jgi:CDP-diacylglycerol--glycerol-3-phosphate 3-phosphatidyltransferase
VKLADTLSASRIVLAPIFFVAFFLPQWLPVVALPRTVPVLWAVFVIAEMTDLFDGLAARKLNQVSDFGKLFDPFADTLVQLTCLLCFVLAGYFPVILYLIVIYREFAILFVRNLMLRKGVALGARLGGKLKTVCYIAACGLALLAESFRRLSVFSKAADMVAAAALAVFIAAVVLAVASFLDYVKVYRKGA